MKPLSGAEADTAVQHKFREADSFRDFYRAHHEHIRRVLFRLGVGRELSDLDDVVQDTFVSAWAKAHTFHNRSQPQTWLMRIAINKARDALRKKRRSPLLQELDDQLPAPLPQVSEELEKRDLVEKALHALCMDHRVVVVLCLIEEYSLEEVSKILNIPLGTVKSRLSRARQAVVGELRKLGVEQ